MFSFANKKFKVKWEIFVVIHKRHLHGNGLFVVKEDAKVEWLTVLSHVLNNRIIGCLVYVGSSN